MVVIAQLGINGLLLQSRGQTFHPRTVPWRWHGGTGRFSAVLFGVVGAAVVFVPGSELPIVAVGGSVRAAHRQLPLS